MDAAAQRKDGDAGEGGRSGRLLNLAQRDCCTRSVGICSDQVRVAVVVVISGIDGIGKDKATDGGLRWSGSLKCAVTVALIDQGTCTAAGDNVRDSITVDIGKMWVGWNIREVGHGRLKCPVTISEKDKETLTDVEVRGPRGGGE